MVNKIKKKASTKTYLGILLALSILSLIVSFLVHLQKTTNPQALETICTATSGANSCYTVQNSIYGSIFGISNAILGMIGFGILAGLITLQLYFPKKTIFYTILTGIFIAGISAISLLYIQAFVLKVYCIYCLVIDLLSLVMVGICFIVLSLKH